MVLPNCPSQLKIKQEAVQLPPSIGRASLHGLHAEMFPWSSVGQRLQDWALSLCAAPWTRCLIFILSCDFLLGVSIGHRQRQVWSIRLKVALTVGTTSCCISEAWQQSPEAEKQWHSILLVFCWFNQNQDWVLNTSSERWYTYQAVASFLSKVSFRQLWLIVAKINWSFGIVIRSQLTNCCEVNVKDNTYF